ncbi:MAG: alpha-glucosidase C-terminal domain-containing protein, partial [Pseudorhizobium sp.]
VDDDQSIWSHYRTLIDLRKHHQVIVYGRYQSWLDQHPDVFLYSRTLENDRLVVVANFRPHEVTVTIPDELQRQGQFLIGNYSQIGEIGETITLKAYEAFALLCRIDG